MATEFKVAVDPGMSGQEALGMAKGPIVPRSVV
jgi:hypothetical protein